MKKKYTYLLFIVFICILIGSYKFYKWRNFTAYKSPLHNIQSINNIKCLLWEYAKLNNGNFPQTKAIFNNIIITKSEINKNILYKYKDEYNTEYNWIYYDHKGINNNNDILVSAPCIHIIKSEYTNYWTDRKERLILRVNGKIEWITEDEFQKYNNIYKQK